MSPDSPPSSFERFEDARNRLGSGSRAARFERWTSPHTHPGASATRVTVTKLRIIAMFVLRRLAQGGGRRDALGGLRAAAGSATGKTILVVGSGPSAEKLDPRAVAKAQKSGDIMVVATNHFLASALADSFPPDYLVWSDDTFNPDRAGHNRGAWDLLARHPEVTLVCPWTWRRTVETKKLPHTVIYFDDDSLEGISKNISPLRPRGYQGTTGVKAVALAAHLRPQLIQVIGLDLSYFQSFSVDGENRITRHPTHLAGTDSGNQVLNSVTLLGMADLLYSTANQFRALHTHFGRLSIENLDRDSLVDAFPKVSDSELLRQRYRAK